MIGLACVLLVPALAGVERGDLLRGFRGPLLGVPVHGHARRGVRNEIGRHEIDNEGTIRIAGAITVIGYVTKRPQQNRGRH